MKQEKSAGVIVFRGSPPKFLLLHYPAGHWDYPKGNVEEGEKEEETALRELKEETGISKASLVPSFKESIHYFYRLKGKKVSKTVVFFLASVPEEKVTLSHEHVGFKWLSYDSALKQLTFKNAKEQLKKAMQILKER